MVDYQRVAPNRYEYNVFHVDDHRSIGSGTAASVRAVKEAAVAHIRAGSRRARRDRDPRDNSFGLGYYPPPAKIGNLGRFVDNLTPSRVLSVKVYPREGVWLVETRADERLSIMQRDMESLLRLGLVRIQVNRPGTITFYIQDKPLPVVGDVASDRARRAQRRRTR